ncbi:AAA family ATPase [Streptomyces sp. NPDC093982]|uniref:AAA family ATPase n=1 Tax=Streptomyces sp. NPDC093982 TaxID=3155077 RepID=UPI003440FB70
MRETASPFEFDGPVPVDRMINRRSEVDSITEWTREGRLMVLVAPRRYGKTSLIRKIASEGEKVGLVVITVDLFEVASLADLVLRLERAWAQHTPDKLRPVASKILAAAQAGVSITGAGFALAMADRPTTDPEPALHALLELPAQLAQREGGRTLIVLDEFQSVTGVAGAETLIWQHARPQREAVSYLLSGVRPDMLSAATDDKEHPSGQVAMLRLDRLPAAELREVINNRFTAGDRDVTGVLDGLLAAGEGHPQRTMLLAHLLWQEVPAGERATGDHLEAAVTVALTQVDPEARATMSGLTVGQRKVLRAVAEYGTPMATRALRTLGLPKTTAQKAAPHLVAAALIEDTDQGWRVIDPLLARWIRTNYGTRA